MAKRQPHRHRSNRGVFLDTQVFVASGGCDFDHADLRALLQHVKAGRISVILTDVVEREVEARLRERAEGIASGISNAQRKAEPFKDSGLFDPGFFKAVEPASVLRAIQNRFRAFLGDGRACIVSTADVPVSEVLDEYFARKAPFGEGKKKSEFPDAISMAALKRYAVEAGLVVEVVSGDGDIKAACAGMDKLRHHDRLAQLLEVLSKEQDEERPVVEAFQEQFDELSTTLESRIRELGFWETTYGADVDEVSDVQVSLSRAFVIEKHGTTGTLGAEVMVSFTATCSMPDPDGFYKDPDGDLVSVGRVANTDRHTTLMLAEFEFSITPGSPPAIEFTPDVINDGEDVRFSVIDGWDRTY